MSDPAPSPYEPPRAPIGEGGPRKKDAALTVGYLIGGLVQLGLGAGLILRKALAESPGVSLLGLLLVFLGIRAIAKYRARTRDSRRTP